LFGSEGKVIVWQTPKEEFDSICTIPTVKHGGENIKYWGCFSSSGVGNIIFINGNMTEEIYRAILQKSCLSS
jgi:hypothetical protein